MIDVSSRRDPQTKARALRDEHINQVPQNRQYANPQHRIAFGQLSETPPLEVYANCLAGIMNGDSPKFIRSFWEIPAKTDNWAYLQSTVSRTGYVGGLEKIIFYDEQDGHLREDPVVRRQKLHNSDERGNSVWGKRGVAISQMSNLPAALYFGNKYDSNVAAIVPKDPADLAAIWTFCESQEFHTAVRAIDKKLNVTNATFGKIPFDREHWQQIASQKYPAGLPNPQTHHPRQWIFSGRPDHSETPLQVAVARLLGYRWPRQTGSGFLECPPISSDGLETHADSDGIVCLGALRGQPTAAQRIRALLAQAFGTAWSAAKLSSLLSQEQFDDGSLDEWLRDAFFDRHCELFYQRPFIWHIWDGRLDGFNAMVNYHRLVAPNGDGRRTLETLIYTYLGDWIASQRSEQAKGVAGSDGRLAAAEHLKTELEKILKGEPPYDIFVRWKPLHQQSIGWEPDLNDGVRLNIRPFMMAKPFQARGSNLCILRSTPNVNWERDRGKEPHREKSDFPWFWGWDGEAVDFEGGRTFDGNRWNNLHYSNRFKRAAREKHKISRSSGE